jgi:hypothetical protein
MELDDKYRKCVECMVFSTGLDIHNYNSLSAEDINSLVAFAASQNNINVLLDILQILRSKQIDLCTFAQTVLSYGYIDTKRILNIDTTINNYIIKSCNLELLKLSINSTKYYRPEDYTLKTCNQNININTIKFYIDQGMNWFKDATFIQELLICHKFEEAKFLLKHAVKHNVKYVYNGICNNLSTTICIPGDFELVSLVLRVDNWGGLALIGKFNRFEKQLEFIEMCYKNIQLSYEWINRKNDVFNEFGEIMQRLAYDDRIDDVITIITHFDMLKGEFAYQTIMWILKNKQLWSIIKNLYDNGYNFDPMFSNGEINIELIMALKNNYLQLLKDREVCSKLCKIILHVEYNTKTDNHTLYDDRWYDNGIRIRPVFAAYYIDKMYIKNIDIYNYLKKCGCNIDDVDVLTKAMLKEYPLMFNFPDTSIVSDNTIHEAFAHSSNIKVLEYLIHDRRIDDKVITEKIRNNYFGVELLPLLIKYKPAFFKAPWESATNALFILFHSTNYGQRNTFKYLMENPPFPLPSAKEIETFKCRGYADALTRGFCIEHTPQSHQCPLCWTNTLFTYK